MVRSICKLIKTIVCLLFAFALFNALLFGTIQFIGLCQLKKAAETEWIVVEAEE